MKGYSVDEKLIAEDVKKLHLEIAQLAQQRFVLTTLAVSAFGAVVTWQLSPAVGGNHPLQHALFHMIGLQVLLLFLFLVNYSLLRKCRTLSTYLIVRKWSQWERDWQKFRENVDMYMGYTITQGAVYFFLFVLSMASPLLLDVLKSGSEPVLSVCVALLGLSAAGFVVWVTRLKIEHKVQEKWEFLIKAPSGQQGVSWR